MNEDGHKKEKQMKKMILVCAMICAGQLYGMGDIGKLPKEVQVLIIQALNSSNDIDSIINSIKAASSTSKALNQMVNEQYNLNNLKGFTTLVGILADKASTSLGRFEIAQKFNTPIAQEYMDLGGKFVALLNADKADLVKIKELINKGLDPNFSFKGAASTNLKNILSSGWEREDKMAALKLLLDAGAIPTTFIKEYQTRLDARVIGNHTAEVLQKRKEDLLETLNLLKRYEKQ